RCRHAFRVLLFRRPLSVVPEHSAMKIPDLAVAADAGVRDWPGAPESIKAAATAAKLHCCIVDLHSVGGKSQLMDTLGKGLKLPGSALVVVYTPDLRVLLLDRADYPEHWQSVTGGQEPGETLQATAVRELREETGLDAEAFGGVVDWRKQNVYEIFPRWRSRY